MIPIVLLLLAQGATPQSPAQDEIVVIGNRAEQGLADCLARACPPAQEIEASLQAAVEQFGAARYATARQTLQAAIRRNRDHAAQLPGPVSSLHATLATVAEHEGDAKLWRNAARNGVLVLREHLGEAHPATLARELSFADNLLGQGDVTTADSLYAVAQRRAIETGQPQLAATAAIRRAWAALVRRQDDQTERFASEAVALAGPQRQAVAEMRDILRARIAIRRGDPDAVDALAARLRQSTGGQPQLLFAPPLPDMNIRAHRDALGFIADRNPWHDGKLRFADVGYWVRPDGRTTDAEVLRTSGLDSWGPGILRHVAERRYVPVAAEPGSVGRYRIDRFTVRGTRGTPAGSRIPRRIGRLTVHVVDLTETEAMSAAARRRVADATAR